MIRRLLIVEDDRALREAMVMLLTDPEYEITAVGTMAEALAAPVEWDGMVLDERLPDGSGSAIAAHFSTVPVVTVSGAEGATLAKPFTGEALRAAVANLWRSDA